MLWDVGRATLDEYVTNIDTEWVPLGNLPRDRLVGTEQELWILIQSVAPLL